MRTSWGTSVSEPTQSLFAACSFADTVPASYYDHARDYLHLVNFLRDDMIQPIVGFGHSMGGNVIINLALLHPRLLTTVIAVEPVINTSPAEMDFIGTFPLTIKKDRWPSREAAMTSITKSPFYAHWDPRVLSLFREHGLRSLPTSAAQNDTKDTVTLTTTKHQEVLSFARAAFPPSRTQNLASFVPTLDTHPDLGADRHASNAFYRPESTMTFQQLPYLRPSCFFVYGANSHMAAGRAPGRKDKLESTGTATGGSGGAAVGRVQEKVVKGSHFVPFEIPDEIADILSQWYDGELDRWHQQEADEKRTWNATPIASRSAVSEDWVHWVHKLWGRKGNSSAKGRGPKASSKL